MIKGMKPLMSDAAGAGVLSKGEDLLLRAVVRRDSGASSGAVVQGQRSAQRNHGFRYTQDAHQITQSVVKIYRCSLLLGTRHPASGSDAIKTKALPDFTE